MRIALGLLLTSQLACFVVGASSAHAQVFVYPRRPNQTNVRYGDFDWKYIDVHVKTGKAPKLTFPSGSRLHSGVLRPPDGGSSWAWPSVKEAPRSRRTLASGSSTSAAPAAGLDALPKRKHDEHKDGSGGVRLYFYEREREIAERAAASIDESYRYLADEFDYHPQQTFAYFLYASYIEFLQTDLFPLQEGVLGVTSPETLEVTLPYFGDARLFEDVSTHELAHEFTIQKIATAAERAGIVGNPIDSMPLWFIEGLAEYYAKRGIDPETDMFVRDILVNPKSANDYVLGSFWEDRLTSGLWTYKVGQARCAFLEETFGKGTLQRILQESPRLYEYDKDGGVQDFARLVAKVTGTSASAIAARFERWVKKRAFATFLNAKHDRSHFTTLHSASGIVQSLVASPSGELVLYRSIDPDTGQNRLYLFDRKSPSDDEVVAADGVPGMESLHPIAGRNFDLTDHELAFVAQAAGADVIYLQRFVEAAEPEDCGEDEGDDGCDYDIDIELTERRMFELRDRGIDAVDTLTLAPDGKRIAFVGLSVRGQKDVYLLTPGEDEDFELKQLTDDIYAERGMSWGPQGIVFASDATGSGKYNLFRVDADARDPKASIVRLTTEARDQMDPEAFPDGRVYFIAYDEDGANIHSVKDGVIQKESDVATGLFDVTTGPNGALWALHHYGADRRPVRIAKERLLGRVLPKQQDLLLLEPPATLSLARAKPYDPLLIENWKLGSIFLLAGVAGDTLFGQISASATDRLRDHVLLLSLATFGDFDLTDASLMYVNEERRVLWGAGIFNDVRSRVDRSFEQSDDLWFVSWERFFGAETLVRYPFSRFVFLQGTLAAGGTEYFLLDDTRRALADPPDDIAGRNLYAPWLAANTDLRFQTEASIAFGYDTVGLHRSTGPIRGDSALLSLNVGVQPFDDMRYEQLRADAAHHFPIIGAVNLVTRIGAGTTFGSERAPQYYLSSFHTLRGVPFGDTDYLLGREFVYATAELQFPIIEFLSFPLIDLEGVLAFDTGAVADERDLLWRRRLLDFVFGVNLGFGPIVIALHFGQPIDIGPIEAPNDGDLTFNLSLNWRYQ